MDSTWCLMTNPFCSLKVEIRTLYELGSGLKESG